MADTEGFAQTLWYRAGGAEGAAVAVDARTPSGSSFREIRLTRSTPGYALRQHSGNYESWFEKTPLRHPVVVEIVRADAADDSVGRITSPETCSRLRVAFTRIGTGSVTPDTVMAGVDSAEVGQNPHRLGCFARANWTLGEGPGRRHARMSLVGGNSGRSSVLYEAYARASPRLIGGIMATRSRSYLGPQAGPERTIRIERTLPDGSKASFDTTFATGRDTVKQVDGSWAPAAFVGVSTPIRPKWHRWALTFGVDPRAVDRNWYAGVSVLRIPGGLEVESLPVDIHLLGHWGRVDVLENPKACRERGECDTEDDVRWQGLAAMLSVDAGSVITDLIKKLSGS
ncbi:hypothetical protein [Longimicrobium sp.]|uniref:hypothetical protein n=1 Tax=Longimicrobium sp. TaxID=2029185 RepID=UPI002F93D423